MNITQHFRNKGINIKNEYVQHLKEETDYSVDEIFEKFLNTDISETCNSNESLITALQKKEYSLEKSLVVQIDEVVDVSIPRKDRSNNKCSDFPTYKLLINDGGMQMAGVMQTTNTKINSSSTPGIKIEIKEGTLLCYGVFLLHDSNINYHGGSSPNLIKKKRKTQQRINSFSKMFSKNELKSVPDQIFGIESIYHRSIKCSNSDSGAIGFIRTQTPNKEENKIIIVSLTRSDKLGFVKTPNRALVTLSRARDMLVVLGNRNIFGSESKSELWRRIIESSEEINPYFVSHPDEEGIIAKLCPIHDNTDKMYTFIQNPEDLIIYRLNYCNKPCGFLLSCGHICKLTCHCMQRIPTWKEHRDYICHEQCNKHCSLNHRCQGICHECQERGKCPDCQFEVRYKFTDCEHDTITQCHLVTSKQVFCNEKCNKKLPCGHQCQGICGECKKIGKCPECKVKVSYVFPDCNHESLIECYLITSGEAQCHHSCDKILPCGHHCQRKCYICKEKGSCSECIFEVPYKFPDCEHKTMAPCYLAKKNQVNCTEQCNQILPCGHRCQGICGECKKNGEHKQCEEQVPYKFIDCGHEITTSCYLATSNQVFCRTKCNKKLPCGHQCQGICGECKKNGEHPNCKLQIRYKFPDCGHESFYECHSVTSGTAKCQWICGKKLGCGHKCKYLCYECKENGKCLPCKATVPYIFPDCPHQILIECNLVTSNQVFCTEKCCQKLPCGHQCSGICGECKKNGKHPKCKHQVLYKFPDCNHRKMVSCYLITSNQTKPVLPTIYNNSNFLPFG